MKTINKYLPIFIGSIVILGLIVYSFVYSIYLKDHIKPPPTYLYNKEGRVIDTYGYSPSWSFPFGVDRFGRDVFWMVIEGAKYTILFALAVGFLRVVFGLFFGVMYGFASQKIKLIVDPFVHAFRFIPAAIMVIPIFMSIEMGAFGKNHVVLHAFVISLIAVPMITSTLGEEIRAFLRNDYIISSKLIGARSFWLVRKHVFPYLRSRILLMFVQQTIQTLFLLTQLGIFHLYVGGMKVLYLDFDMSREVSKANEWSAMIGGRYIEIGIDPWVIIGPSIGFVVTIFAFNLIKIGIERIINLNEIKMSKISQDKENDFDGLNDFDFVNKKKSVENQEEMSFILT